MEQKDYDINRLERIVQELRDELNSNKQHLATTQVDADSTGRKFNDLSAQLNLSKQRLVDCEAEVRALREARATLQREVDMLHEVCNIVKRYSM